MFITKPTLSLEPSFILTIIIPLPQGILLTSTELEALTCGDGGGNSKLGQILLVPEKQQTLLQAYRTAVCGGGAVQRAERFGEMSQALKEQIDTQRIVEKV